MIAKERSELRKTLLKSVVEEGILTPQVAEKYLNLYLGEITEETRSWEKQLVTLWNRLSPKQYSGDERKEMLRKIISCAILLPAFDSSVKPDVERPEKLLFWVSSFTQFQERDWFATLQEVIKKDLEIESGRKKLLELGIIDPIDYAPLTRQAFNWLYGEAEKSGAINDSTKPDITKRFTSLVWAYGGMTISNIFSKHHNKVDTILNWRTGYFFERQIYKVYSLDQLLKIKTSELAKTNSKLVKTVR